MATHQPKQPPSYDPNEDRYWDGNDVLAEEQRQFDVCHGCRLCNGLCPSFPALFELTDRIDGEVSKITNEDLRPIEDLCYQCKLCYVACPYTPPHEFSLDVPRLLMRKKFVTAKTEGVKFKDRVLGDQDRLGKVSSKVAPLVNTANNMISNRLIMEKVLGVHRNASLPKYHGVTFAAWFKKRYGAAMKPSTEPVGKVAFFHTCTINYNDPEVGKACIQVLEKNNIEVVVPEQECCGMPFVDGGDYSRAHGKMESNLAKLVKWVDEGYDIVAPSPTCSLMLRDEYPTNSPESEAAKRIAERTFEFGHYLWKLNRAKILNKEFTKSLGKVNFHVACHTRAQYIGSPSSLVLAQVPDTTVNVIEQCSAHDGTWGVSKDYHELSLKVGQKLFNNLQQGEPSLLVTDCPQSAMQINHAMGVKPVHTAVALRDAYGLPRA